LADNYGLRDVPEDGPALVRHPAIDAVIVASPDETHADLVLECITAGKPVLVEKPLAGSVQGCGEIMLAEQKKGKRLVQVAYMRRFDPGYLAMRQAVVDASYGLPLFLHCIHRNAVAPHFMTSDLVITNSVVHEIDVGRFLLGCEFVSALVVSPRASSKAPSRQPQFVVLESASGVVMDVEAFVDAQYGYEVRAELVCEEGTVSLAPAPPVTLRHANRDGIVVEPIWLARFRDAYGGLLQAWTSAVTEGRNCGSSAWDGYAATRTADACLEAARSGARVAIELERKPAFYD
jgi:myo-inositol 2-dehydrogenase/D-chiro-inositol 1-dehydrogenase